MNYYNEIDLQAAQWLRELIRQGHLPEGVVDTRSIREVQPEDLRGFIQCHFFAGIGGWPLAFRMAGIPDTQRAWSGSAPCQPFSIAGLGRGSADERHLYPEFHRLIAAEKPPVVFGEQVAGKDGKSWLRDVFDALELCGYWTGGADLCAAGVGAPHGRDRLYWVAADPLFQGVQGLRPSPDIGPHESWWMCGPEDLRSVATSPFERRDCRPPSLLRGVDDGIPGRVGLLRGYGNAIVPQLAAKFLQASLEAIDLMHSVSPPELPRLRRPRRP